MAEAVAGEPQVRLVGVVAAVAVLQEGEPSVAGQRTQVAVPVECVPYRLFVVELRQTPAPHREAPVLQVMSLEVV